eukprot:gene5546-4001_t
MYAACFNLRASTPCRREEEINQQRVFSSCPYQTRCRGVSSEILCSTIRGGVPAFCPRLARQNRTEERKKKRRMKEPLRLLALSACGRRMRGDYVRILHFSQQNFPQLVYSQLLESSVEKSISARKQQQQQQQQKNKFKQTNNNN